MGYEPIQLEGDWILPLKVGAWMWAPILPAAALYRFLGTHNLWASTALVGAYTLAFLSLPAFWMGMKFLFQRVELIDGRLRAANSTQDVTVGVDELEELLALEGQRGYLLLAFKARGTWTRVDPRSFPRDRVDALLAALREARPGLPGSIPVTSREVLESKGPPSG